MQPAPPVLFVHITAHAAVVSARCPLLVLTRLFLPPGWTDHHGIIHNSRPALQAHITAESPHLHMLQAQMAGAENMRHSHATFDLNNALMEGQFPKWDFFIQTMDPTKQNDYRFDPLDCTKVCTHPT